MEKKVNYTLITGSTGGLGRAFCEECLKQGHNLLISATNQQRLNCLKEELEKKYSNAKILAKECNLADEQSRKMLEEYIKSNNVQIDYLINNAGYITEGKFENYNEEEIVKTIRVNCEGTINLTHKILNMRDESKELKILTICSLSAYYPMPQMAIYSATKAMIKNFFLALAVEYKNKNVFFTTVFPAGIPTTDAMKEAIKAQGFNGKVTSATPEYIAKNSLKYCNKHKKEYVPKFINRFVRAISRPLTDNFLAKTTGKMWSKSQNKRSM